ncbi:hypothetical protein R1sor_019337 [Riccia sorocarpa]|uniref:Secreted protein n=1 Tax=Riccia sorocarpa TaxID=122646 RepID=A0ABD3IG11_9MARC
MFVMLLLMLGSSFGDEWRSHRGDVRVGRVNRGQVEVMCEVILDVMMQRGYQHEPFEREKKRRSLWKSTKSQLMPASPPVGGERRSHPNDVQVRRVNGGRAWSSEGLRSHRWHHDAERISAEAGEKNDDIGGNSRRSGDDMRSCVGV